MTAADPLRTVGVLGGMSSESSRDYYRLLDEGVGDALGGHNAADLVLYSVNFATVESFIRSESWDEAGRFLAEKARRLEAAGAEFVVMATNTMHRVAPAIEAALDVPLVHIVDVTADAIREAGLSRVGVLGTKAAMESDFYSDRFADHGIDVVVPDAATRDRVDEIIFGELVHGVVRDDSRQAFLSIMDDLADAGAEGLVLGCTEIELLVDQSDFPAAPLFDTTALHVERAVELALGERPLP
jgi:aspartate racemase